MTTDIERGGIDVSGSPEPSYYEIALTNRQVVVAFVILLTCLVAAFLSGVWIGRESAARAQERLASLARGAAAAGDADKEKPEGQALQEFKFFADPHHRPAAAGGGTPASAGARRSAETPSRGEDSGGGGSPSTLADDLSHRGQSGAPPRSAAAPAPAPGSSVSNEAAPAGRAARSAAKRAAAPPAAADSSVPAGEGEPLPPATATSGSPAASAGAADSEVVRPRPLPDATGRAAAAAPQSGRPASGREGRAGAATAASAASGAESGGDLVIQVFSSADKEQADRVRDRLVGAGLTAYLSPLAKNGQTMYRVRIGPFRSRADAEPVAERVRKEHKLDTWITPK